METPPRNFFLKRGVWDGNGHGDGPGALGIRLLAPATSATRGAERERGQGRTPPATVQCQNLKSGTKTGPWGEAEPVPIATGGQKCCGTEQGAGAARGR